MKWEDMTQDEKDRFIYVYMQASIEWSRIQRKEKEMLTHPICNQCGKEIWGISKILFTLGVEMPVLLHGVCYEQLVENAGGDK